MTDRSTEIKHDADALALFSNADAQTEIEYFRANYAEFFPRDFWNWRVPQTDEGVSIHTATAQLAEAVKRLKIAAPIPFWQAFQYVVRAAWQAGFPLEECVRLISCAAVPDRLSGQSDAEPDLLSYAVWPYQRAVMQLGVEPWRARFCGQCGKRFVAEKPARRFCSEDCSSRARKSSKMDWWNRAGQKQRAQKGAKGRSQRGKR